MLNSLTLKASETKIPAIVAKRLQHNLQRRHRRNGRQKIKYVGILMLVNTSIGVWISERQ
jgi:hypothetical protein